MVELLVKTAKLNLNAKNYEERSAFDVATNQEIRTILLRSGANFSATNNVVTYANTFKSKMTLRDKITTSIRRIRCDITENQQNIYLIIATLIITTTYETVLSPPGGLYQVNATDVNTDSNSTELYGGTPVVPGAFNAISGINALSILVSTTTIWILTPTTSLLGSALMLPILFLCFSYILSAIIVSGSIASIILCLFPLICLALWILLICSNIKKLLAGLKYDLGQSCYSQNY